MLDFLRYAKLVFECLQTCGICRVLEKGGICLVVCSEEEARDALGC